MSNRLETDRRIESALSLFVVAVVLGSVGEIVTRSGQSTFWWLVRARGFSASQASLTSMAWSWAAIFHMAGRFALLIGLWRLSRSLVGGRARGLAAAALWANAASLVVALAQQVVFSAARDWGSETYQRIAIDFAIAGLVVYVVGAGLWLASLVGLARTTPEGARRTWAGLVAAAALAVLVDVGFSFYGSAQLLQWPAVAIVAGLVATAIHAAGILAVLVPVRRAFRAALVSPEAPDAGPYRSANLPGSAWRTAPELRLAGEGIAEVRRRVGQLGVLMLLSLPFFFILTGPEPPPWSGYVGLVLGAIQVGFTVPMVLGLARYTRAPFELLGRSLGIGALACLTAAVVISARSLIFLFGGLRGWAPAMGSMATDTLAAAAGWIVGTALLVGSLARAARGLGDLEVRRRAFTALFTYFGCIGGTVLLMLVAVASLGVEVGDGRRFTIFIGFGLAFICLAVYRWLLGGAAEMLTRNAGSA